MMRKAITRPDRSALVAMVAAAVALLGVVSVPAARADLGPGDCSFYLHADADLVNIAFPDSSAQYWAAQVPLVPGVQIKGFFPRARYFSFNAYEGSLPVDAITDYQIQPAAGSTDPFVAGAKVEDTGGAYTIDVVGGPRPPAAQRAPNTLYAGQGENGEPVPATVILYRVYIGAGANGSPDQAGGVPLPQITYSAPGAASPSACGQFQPTTGGAVNQQIAAASDPYNSSAAAPTTETWGVSRSQPGPATVGPESLPVNSDSPFFPNFDNEYLSLLVWKNAGDLLVIKMKAPTFPDLPGDPKIKKMPDDYDLRYWSFCANDFPTTRYVGCLPDYQAKVDANGYVTVVVSDPNHRPTGLLATDNWIPAGPYPDMFILYRNMLPTSGFPYAVQDIPVGGTAASTMGVYYPKAIMCTVAQFGPNRCGIDS